MLKLNKETLIETEAGKEIPPQGDKPSAGRVGSLSLGKEVFWAQDPFLCGQVWVERLHA